MRTVHTAPRWLTSILALALAAPASAQEAAEEPPAADVPAETPAEEAEEIVDDAPHCARTGVEGVVRDAETRETLIEAPVIVVGGSRTLTDYDGRYAIDLPPGTYSLRSHYDLYQPVRVDDVVVRRGECTHVDLELESDASVGEEVVIEVRADTGTAATQLRERRETVASQDSLSAEEMSRSGDSSASDAARRAVGVTTRDDYVYVRGLGGRYVVTLMNGVALPSTDPDVPGVQLDVFPAGLLDSLTIRKTFTPEVPGDRAGGLLDIGTRTYPDDFQLRAGVSLGMNTGSSFRYVRSGQQGGLDWIGVDDGTRSIPAEVRAVDSNLEDLDRSTIDSLGASFRNTWLLGSRLALPNMGLSLSVGDSFTIDGRRAGFLLMAGYRYSERPVPDFIRSLRLEGEGDERQVMVRETLAQQGNEMVAQASALGTFSIDVAEGHRLSLVGLVTQTGEDFAGHVTGRNEESGIDISAYRLNWVQRTMAFAQLLGEHRIHPHLTFDWQLHLGYGRRSQPDVRDVFYTVSPTGQLRFAAGAGSGTRFFSDLEDFTYGGGGNFTVPIDTLTIRAGGLVRRSDRHLDARRFGWQPRAGAEPEGFLLPPEQLFDPTTQGMYLRLRDLTRSDDGYDASQSVYAAYGSLEWRPVQPLRLVGGTRVEGFRQVVVSSTPYALGDDVPQSTRRTDLDAMPSIGAAWEIIPSMFARASYAGTVARPQVRELAPFLFIDFVRRRTVSGNVALERSYIHNFDVRWEWFPSESEVLAVSGFAKLFESPIEPTIVSSAGDITFRNIQAAENFGLELEARMSFRHFARELDWIGIGANFTLVHSRAVLSPEQRGQATSPERPLAGQPPWILNFSLGLEPPGTNLRFDVFYNVFGPRLEDVGLMQIPDVYREPFHDLSASISWTPDPILRLRLAGQNILAQRQILRQGDFVVLGLDPGVQISVSAALSY
jgi:hypothetical protein